MEYSVRLSGANIFRSGSLGAFFKFKFHGLAFGQGAEPLHLDFGLVAKTVLPSVIGSDETEAFRIIEPLDFTYHDKLHLLKACEPSPSQSKNQTGEAHFQ